MADDRTIAAIKSRHNAGESIESLAYDYGLTDRQIIRFLTGTLEARSMLDLKDFNKAIGAISADWRSREGLTAAMILVSISATATVGPFSLGIQHSRDGSIGWVSIDARVGGGIELWRSRNEKGVALSEVIHGMREYLRGVSEDLAAVGNAQ